MNEATEARFWSKVSKSEGCWEWTAALRSGYGVFYADGRLHRAHRVSWEIANGPIAEGLLVCHRCDNRRCVRPDHLFLGTSTDNNRDMTEKGRHGTAHKPTCKRGHPLTGFRRAGNQRYCPECNYQRKVKVEEQPLCGAVGGTTCRTPATARYEGPRRDGRGVTHYDRCDKHALTLPRFTLVKRYDPASRSPSRTEPGQDQ